MSPAAPRRGRRSFPPSLGRYTVVAPDLLGHGESDKPRHDYSLGAYANMVRDLMIALGIDRATIVGHSFGGGVAMQFAYQHPSRCERLVLESSGGLGPEISWIFRALTVPGAEYLMPLIFPSFVRRCRRRHRERDAPAGRSRPEPRAELACLRRAHQGREPPRLPQHVALGDRQEWPDGQRPRPAVPGSAWVPTLIVWGGRDRIIPVEHAIAAHEAMASSQLVIFERVGTLPARRGA